MEINSFLNQSNSEKEKVVVLVDCNKHGHHPTYQKLLTKYFLERGFFVLLICSEPQLVNYWIKGNININLLQNFSFLGINPINKHTFLLKHFSAILNWFVISSFIKKFSRQTLKRPDLVFFLKFEDMTQGFLINKYLFDLLFKCSWSGIYIHFPNTPGKRKAIVHKFFYNSNALFRSKYFLKIHTLQENCVSYLEQKTGKPVILLPDFTDISVSKESRLANLIKAKSKGKKIIGCLGGQDTRKGTLTLLKIAEILKNDDKLFFVFIGKMNYLKSDLELDRIKKWIAEKNISAYGNCFLYFNRLESEAEFNSIFKICDVIFAVYKNFFYSSNIMTKAAYFKIPIVVNHQGLMAERVKRHQIGALCGSEDLSSCIRAIKSVLANKPSKDNFEKYYANHSLEKLYASLDTFSKKI